MEEIFNENKDGEMKIDKIILNQIKYIETNDMCIICFEVEGNVKLCLFCKFKYCHECANKLLNKCSICFRNNRTNTEYNNYDYDYDDYYVDRQMSFSNNYYIIMVYLSLILSLSLSFIKIICIIILLVLLFL